MWDEVKDLIDAGDQVVSVHASHARGRASGVAVDLAHIALVWTFRQGKIVRVTLFTTRAEALEAAGLRELVISQAAYEHERLTGAAAEVGARGPTSKMADSRLATRGVLERPARVLAI